MLRLHFGSFFACNAKFDKITESKDAVAALRTQDDPIGFKNLKWGRDMKKFATGLLATVLLMTGVGTSHAAVRIADDRGGRIGIYVDRYQGLRSSGEAVIIDGLCASACTIVLGKIPYHKICVTPNATLGFHAAWNFGPRGGTISDPEATQIMYSMYPSRVRHWIARRGGLTPHMIFLRGKQLEAMYRPCYLDPAHPRAGRNRTVRDRTA